MEINSHKNNIMMRVILSGFFFILFILVGSSTVWAQNMITGTVTDASSGKTLPGVNILVKGTTSGVATDTDGNYQLEVPSLQDSLVFSFVGYQTKTIPINGRSEINVSLTTKSYEGQEAVVVGFGEQKKETITGAISSIKGDKLTQSPAANLSVSLAGRLPGLTSIQRSSKPGGSVVNLYLRGRGTINGQNPLILVDGIERDINFINPQEVADVTILKDASATAIYGVRGANGVVIVTTKTGKTTGKPEINVNVQYGLQGYTRTPSTVIPSYEWALLKNQATRNDNIKPEYSYEELNRFLDGGNPLYPDNRWRDMFVKKYAPKQKYDLNFSGSAGEANNVRYFVNVGYLNQGGQFKEDHRRDFSYDPSFHLNRFNFRSNINADLTDAFSVFLKLGGYLEKANSPFRRDARVFAGLRTNGAPVAPGPLTPSGEILAKDGTEQLIPYREIYGSGYRKDTRSNILSTFGMNLDMSALTHGLSAKIVGSFDTRSNYNLAGYKKTAVFVPTRNASGLLDGYELDHGQNQPLSLSTGNSFRSKSTFQLFINYDRTFKGKHHITGLLYGQKNLEINPGYTLPFNLIGTATRITYAYNNKYFLEFNGGYNGSEQFAPGNRFGFFPSVSAGWLISGEDFMKNNTTITHLKLRGSYGLVGSDRLGGRRFLYLNNIQRGGATYSQSLRSAINVSYIGNSQIQWEIARKTNIGFEIGIYDQLNLAVDLFRENRDNILIGGNATIPEINGLPGGALPPKNEGTIVNKGYEIVLDYKKAFNNNLSIISKLNFNYAKNKVEYIGEVQRPDDYAYQYHNQGFPIGTQFGYVADGYFNSQDEIDSYADYEIGQKPRPGDLKYKDLNGDDVIDGKDLGPIGYSNVPEYTGGFSFQLNYKNFDVSFLLQGVAHVSDYIPEPNDQGVYEFDNFFEWHRRAWTKERAEKGLPITYPALSTTGSSSTNVHNSFFEDRTDYLRLKNAEIGFTLPLKWTNSKIGSRKVRFYVNGLNMLTWDKMKFSGFDPEQVRSVDYPIYRVFNFGVDIDF